MPEMSRLGRLYAVVLVLTLTSVPAWADLRLLLGGQAHDVTTAEDHTLSLDLVLAEEEVKPECPNPASEMQVRSDPIRSANRIKAMQVPSNCHLDLPKF